MFVQEVISYVREKIGLGRRTLEGKVQQFVYIPSFIFESFRHTCLTQLKLQTSLRLF